MSDMFPKKNDFGTGSFEELVPELARFKIETVQEFRQLMLKHRKKLLANDRDRLSYQEQKWMERDPFFGGADSVRDRVRRQFWWAYPDLVRNAAEYEFGEAAVVVMSEAEAAQLLSETKLLTGEIT